MTHSGDAAEQIVRMSLEGVEVAVRITGTATKEIAAFLVAALKSKNSTLKTKGKARLTAMLKSGKALEIFSVKDSDLQKFYEGAKQYGIVYAVLRDRKGDKDGMCDIMVKADDAPKISRVIERFKFATVDKAKIESEIVKSKAAKAQEGQAQEAGADKPAPDKNNTEKVLDDIMGTPEGKAVPDAPKADAPDVSKATPAKEPAQNPDGAKTAKSRPFEPTSESRSKSAGVTSSKPSVKDELREIKAARAKQEADAPKQDNRQTADKPKPRTSTHKQPPQGGRPKTKKTKAR
jgi:hypothetical protein